MATAAHTLIPLAQLSRSVAQWVNDVRELTQPRAIHWCEGTEAEAHELTAQLVKSGELKSLNPEQFPGCHLYRSAPNDVARVEHLTYICTRSQEDAGPNNHWMDPQAAHAKMRELFRGCMRERTLYVIPYCMGPIDSPLSRCGVEITDSAYVVLNMLIMTRIGRAALERIAREGGFVRGLHSIGELDPERRFIMHFPEELAIESFGSGYGGNALLGKKCHALRIASWQARSEGWLAEHMLIVGLAESARRNPLRGRAFPSACGKTNLAMLIPPDSLPGWSVYTVGDDIAWLHPGDDGRLWAINPEAGYFGVVPGTNPDTNRNAYRDDPPRHALHQCSADGRQPTLVGGADERQAGTRLARAALRSGARSGGASEFALHGLRAPQSELLLTLRRPARCADLGPGVRRSAPRGGAAGV